MNEGVVGDFRRGCQEAFLGEIAWSLGLEKSRDSLGRGGGRAFQSGRTACAKAERCGSSWCVLESVGIRVHVEVYGGGVKWGLAVHHPRSRDWILSGGEGLGAGEQSGWFMCCGSCAGCIFQGQLEGAGDFIFSKFPIRLRGAPVSPSLNWGWSEMARLLGSSSGCLTAGVLSSHCPGGALPTCFLGGLAPQGQGCWGLAPTVQSVWNPDLGHSQGATLP